MLSYSDPQNKIGICSSCKTGNQDSDKVNNLPKSHRRVDPTTKPTLDILHPPLQIHVSWRNTSKIRSAAPLPSASRKSEVAQSCPTFCNPMDCSLPGPSIHGIHQARVLEWVAISFSRGSSRQGLNPGLPHCRQTLYPLSHQGTHLN